VSKIQKNIASIVNSIASDYDNMRPIDKTDLFSQPDSDKIYDIIGKLLRITFPGYYVDRDYKIYNIKTTIAAIIEDVTYNLNKQIVLALRYDKNLQDKPQDELAEISEDKTVKFMQLIPTVREYLDTDIEALFVVADKYSFSQTKRTDCTGFKSLGRHIFQAFFIFGKNYKKHCKYM
jgi:hypothetical protein